MTKSIIIQKAKNLQSGDPEAGYESTRMSFEIHWDDHEVHKRHSGELTAMEFLRSLEKMHADSRFDRIRHIIHDLSSVTSHHLDENSLSDFVAVQFGAQNSNPNFHVAFVCQEPHLRQLLERVLIKEGLSSCPTIVTSSVSAARQWLQQQPIQGRYGRWTLRGPNGQIR